VDFPANADLPTLRAALSKCVRVDRFCDGALGKPRRKKSQAQ
jgi:hypothetical protein